MSETHCESCGFPKPTHADRCPKAPRRLTPVPDSDVVSEAARRTKGPTERGALDFDAMPKGLKEHRTRVRDMMIARCREPNTPIPPALAIRAADWVFFLTTLRANERMKAGKPAFPDQETLLNDIARSAESVETCVLVMQEEARETLDGLGRIASAEGGGGGGGLHILVPEGVLARDPARSPGHRDPERGGAAGEPPAAGVPDGAPEGAGPDAGGE
jgi:hypothetical protein